MEAVSVDLDQERRIPLELEPRCEAVHMAEVDHWWPRASDWIRQALAEAVHHELTAQELYRRCKSGEYLLVLMFIGEALCGAAVLEKSVNARGDMYVCVTAVGGVRMPEWIGEFVRACKALALQAGAVELLIIGRPGWRPYLSHYGARVRSICMTMEV